MLRGKRRAGNFHDYDCECDDDLCDSDDHGDDDVKGSLPMKKTVKKADNVHTGGHYGLTGRPIRNVKVDKKLRNCAKN